MRYFLAVIAFLIALGLAWNWAVVNDGLLQYCDAHVNGKAAPTILAWLGEWDEVSDDREKMRDGAKRVLERYPNSSYAEEAQFLRSQGVSLMLNSQGLRGTARVASCEPLDFLGNVG